MAPRRRHSALGLLPAAAILGAAMLAATGGQAFKLPRPLLTGMRKAASRIARGVTPFSTISTPPPAAAATTSVPVRTPQPTTSYPPMQYAGGDGQVNWARNWYPMAFLDDLDVKRPTQVQLLGKMYVIWADHDKTWHAFEDKCPHRLAPLSEGRYVHM